MTIYHLVDHIVFGQKNYKSCSGFCLRDIFKLAPKKTNNHTTATLENFDSSVIPEDHIFVSRELNAMGQHR